MKKKTVPVLLAAAAALLLTGCASSDGSSSIWGIIAIPLGWIMNYCYIFVNDILHMPLAYMAALFLFALITKALMFPLSLKQQRSSAKMAAFQPLINEINKTYAKDPNKRNQEIQKLYDEVGYNPMSGCLPMLIQFPIIFGLVEVIYKPLTYMLRIPADVISSITEIVEGSAFFGGNARFIETDVISAVKGAPELFSSLGAAAGEYIDRIADLDMTIGSLNLWERPTLGFNLMLIIPLFSVGMMLLSSFVSMKLSGQSDASGAAAGKGMLIFSTVLFGVFSFTYPAAFSLYWGFQSLIIILQSFLLRRICDPVKLRKQAMEEMQAKRKAKKAAKTAVKKVKIKEESGEVVEKEISGSELMKLRLQRARELDEERYGDEKTDGPRFKNPEYFGMPEPEKKGKKSRKDKTDDAE